MGAAALRPGGPCRWADQVGLAVLGKRTTWVGRPDHPELRPVGTRGAPAGRLRRCASGQRAPPPQGRLGQCRARQRTPAAMAPDPGGGIRSWFRPPTRRGPDHVRVARPLTAIRVAVRRCVGAESTGVRSPGPSCGSGVVWRVTGVTRITLGQKRGSGDTPAQLDPATWAAYGRTPRCSSYRYVSCPQVGVDSAELPTPFPQVVHSGVHRWWLAVVQRRVRKRRREWRDQRRQNCHRGPLAWPAGSVQERRVGDALSLLPTPRLAGRRLARGR
ncbi:hypothetical protein DFJ67_4013 [Asanoa ferruginea]|uniref:Uncharacterized protein n=1 Tax=Asanoa ferruginea TaxID=53367 RepID=A0A3D9ZN13_9ACTN|nr:hypothetical protein DFJ67_4013 [Asanoa ferruginea]